MVMNQKLGFSESQSASTSTSDFAPVIALPPDYEVYDFTQGYDAERTRTSLYGIGRYDEVRAGMYTTELFKQAPEPRNIHLGIDIAAPVGEAVMAFADSRVHLAGVNPAEGDYGGTVILECELDGRPIWALFGHLSHGSVARNQPGRWIKRGEVFAWVGDKHENGGWNPHLHFQLSWVRPEVCDLPGTTTASGRAEALRLYPDPQIVLGKLY